MESDYRYYSRRAAEERRRAAQSVTAEARERHSELANMFANRAAQRLMVGEEHQMAGG